MSSATDARAADDPESAATAGEVMVIYVDAGGGHRNAARAMAAGAEQAGKGWGVSLLNLQDVFAPLDHVRLLTGLTIEDVYNLLLRRQLSAIMVPLLWLLHLTVRVRRKTLVKYLAAHFARLPRPLAVVSVMPNFNSVIHEACRKALPGVPFTVVLTDYADFPPHFWIEPELDRVVVGSDEAERQAKVLGMPAARVTRVSGMILHPRHYTVYERDRERSDLKLGTTDFAILLVFGGKGSPEMLPLSRGLLEAAPHLRVVAVCGDNPGLVARLERLATEHPGRLKVFGFTDRLPALLSAADVLVTKPGPGSLAEAFHRGVPVVVARSIGTIPQERYNLRLVEESGVGLVADRWADVPRVVRRLAEAPEQLREMRARIEALPRNRAVFEVVDLIDRDVAHAAP